MRERKSNLLAEVGYLQNLIRATSDEALVKSLIDLGQPEVEEWTFGSREKIEEEPSKKHMMKMFFSEPPGTVAEYRFRLQKIGELKKAVQTPRGFFYDYLLREPLVITPMRWVLSERYGKDFAKCFAGDDPDIEQLFGLTYLAAIRTIERLLKNQKVKRCPTCQIPMAAQGKLKFCSVRCRTDFNNQKRDPTKHNEREKKNRKQRIINKHAKERAKR